MGVEIHARPAYRRLTPGELRERVLRGFLALRDCRLCPRDCGVDRMSGRWAACKTGRHAVVSSAFAHHGEEDCLRGDFGSGTIFFVHCNLRCVFCQNFDISQGIRAGEAEGLPAERIAGLMLGLQRAGCHNINFVTPEHVVPQVLEAVEIAVAGGLNVPIVYNTSAYDSHESLELLEGIVDIYMPDFKVWSPRRAKRWLMAEDYPEAARAAILEMHRQVGSLVLDEQGIAKRGVLIRHLVMPGAEEDTREILHWIARELGPASYVNVMDQYRPAGKVLTRGRFPDLEVRPAKGEHEAAVRMALDLGLRVEGRSA
jgi:putative pyruvate formate lyase activating enzyme